SRHGISSRSFDVRSRSHHSGVAMAAVLTAALSIGAAAVQLEPAKAGAANFGPSEISRAIETVKADPNLATERTIKTLRWTGATGTKKRSTPAWILWIAG